MIGNELNNAYFEWMCRLVGVEFDCGGVSYYKLLSFLYNIDFDYIMAMDGNRAEDGIDLRYRFAHDNNFNEKMIFKYLDNHPCSVLEMMVALAIRCEESIMDNPEIGDRTGKWFWDMIDNLGLSDMNDKRFNEIYTDYIIKRFLQRGYARNGRGGLFFIENCRRDLRTVEIWCQAMWYLDNLL